MHAWCMEGMGRSGMPSTTPSHFPHLGWTEQLFLQLAGLLWARGWRLSTGYYGAKGADLDSHKTPLELLCHFLDPLVYWFDPWDFYTVEIVIFPA